MVAPFQGGCRCGAIRYEVSAEPMATMNCHCRDCQYASGTGFSTVAVVPAAAFKLTKGEPRRFTVKGDSGQDITRCFCEVCGTPLFSEPPGGQIMVVKAGSLDDPSWLKIGGALYTKSAQPWAHIDPNGLKFERMPPGAPGVQ
ncbi:MAG: GFA family protein [Alphaproteobacteria bacterium]|nr:GFA family protein [Alphaproteobacteria bacterium]MBV9539988.1 GFA family protein [Alphaproteobacteria bacterium]